MNKNASITRYTYAGLFMITLATLMFEVLLTRIFSVTLRYHFAFVAISIAVFGMTLGAILVYLFPNYFTAERTKQHLASSGLLFAATIVLSFLAHMWNPFIGQSEILKPHIIGLTFILISIPFTFSGICVCLALTRFPGDVSKLYAADLAGAALGCILLIYVLKITDGPSAVIVTALLAASGAFFFAAEAGHKKLLSVTLIACVLLLALASVNTVMANKQSPLLRLLWMKGEPEHNLLYEKWNSFSRVRVWGDPDKPSIPTGGGISPAFPRDYRVRELRLDIDADAFTPLTAFDGDLEKLPYLKYDVSNLAHNIRRDAKVLVIGAGGGRDVLSALAFDQKSVTAVEINGAIIAAVNQRFGSFTGHLDRDPRVTFVNDEARSYIARQKEKFDIIQVSLIDTWAATNAGAFVLSENSLYTIEGWKIFLNHLTPGGMLSFSRWYIDRKPVEAYRLTSLASASLLQMGIKDPRKHMVMVKAPLRYTDHAPVGTMLVSKAPFTDQDLDALEAAAARLEFTIVLSPRFAIDPVFEKLASGRGLDKYTAAFPINISAPTDDSPFFFHMLRLRDVFNPQAWQKGVMDFNMKAIITLIVLLVIVICLTFLCVIIPLSLTAGQAVTASAVPLFIYFAGIGFGFMLVEISQMQRLIVFLGHPTYALSVILFTLLLSSGIGSYLSQKVDCSNIRVPAITRLSVLLGVLVLFGVLTPWMITALQGATTTVRILAAVAMIFPLGLFMGMAFPLGIKLASSRFADLTSWLWGINGATSVCASVLAVVIALSSSISASYWTGFICYVIALIFFTRASRELVRSDL
ncbi:hypothetical protein ACFL57_03940 [Candidatus Margulisiibacteriota bacterium]